MKSHKDLDVWQEAVSLAEDVYIISKQFPKEEIYGITSQMRRAAVSIASNIAEGAARHTDKDFCHFLSIAAGSASELDTQFEIVKRLELADNNELNRIQVKTDQVSRMLQGLIRSVRNRSK